MEVQRDQIIKVIEGGLKNNPSVFAFWLEGADSTNTVDQYSDIDIWLDVEDGEESAVFSEVERALLKLGELDLFYELEHPHPQIRHKVLHLKDTPDSLLLDVCVQSHSRNFEFVRGLHDEPKVIFDKANAVKFREFDKLEFRRELEQRIYHLKNAFVQKSRVLTKIERGEFLEAMMYYQKWILEPLVELLRIKYIPRKRDYHFKHISRDLPKEVVRQLEDLCKIQSMEEIKQKVESATELFEVTLTEIEREFAVKEQTARTPSASWNQFERKTSR